MTTIDRIKELCAARGIAIARLERDLGFSNGVISKSDTIKDTRLVEVADYLGVSASFLLGEPEDEGYYIDPAAVALAQEMANRPGMKTLFEASRDLSEEDLQIVNQLVLKLTDKK